MRTDEQLFFESLDRYRRLRENPKDIKAGGVVRKLLRTLRRKAEKLNIEVEF